MTTKPSEVRFWSEERSETIKERVSRDDLRLESVEISRLDSVNTPGSFSRWRSKFLLTLENTCAQHQRCSGLAQGV